MKLVFFGTPATAVPSLDATIGAGHEVLAVVTRPDRPSGRSGTPRPSAVKARAVERSLTVSQPESLRPAEVVEAIARMRPDVLVVVAYGRIFPPALLQAAPLGAVNVHFSLLPAYRGAAPVAWALARGASATGVTTFRLDAGLDTGDLLLQAPVPIEPGEHAPSLLARLAERGAALLVETLAGLAAGTIVPSPQDDARATLAPQLRREDGAWSAEWTASELEGRTRGFDPWPGVWASAGTKRLRLVEAAALAGLTTVSPAGTILDAEAGGLGVACAGGTVAELRRVQPEGRRAVTAREARNGRQLAVGDRLDAPRSQG